MDENKVNLRPARTNLADIAVAGFTFLKGVAVAAVDAYETLQVAFMCHSQYVMEKQEFARDAGRAIEAIAKGEE